MPSAVELRLDQEQPLARDLAVGFQPVAHDCRALVGECAQVFRRDGEIRHDQRVPFLAPESIFAMPMKLRGLSGIFSSA